MGVRAGEKIRRKSEAVEITLLSNEILPL